LLENALGSRVIPIDLLLTNDRQFSAARCECSVGGADTERPTDVAILIRYRPLEICACGVTHGWAGNEKRVQPIGEQAGNE
jgi:hypothetical protein